MPGLHVERSAPAPERFAVSLARIAAETGLSPVAAMKDFAALAFGPGKVTFADYVRLRLFDQAYWASDRHFVLGQRRSRDLAVQLNYRHDLYGILADKVAATGYLSAFGLPTAPIRAIWSPGRGSGSESVLTTRDALAGFLRRPDIYPLFGKPIDGIQSLGSVALRGCTADGETLERVGGGEIGLGRFLDEIETHYGDGYLFQPCLSPHPDIAVVCGERLATVRFLTLLGPEGPRIFRACWKVPAGPHAVDNYWRGGNILAQVEDRTGTVLRAVTGTGFDLREVSAHPDTGTPFAGRVLPGWQAMRDLVLAAAGTMRFMPMIGWDVAATASGPVIIEMNEAPDHILPQLADGRGTFDSDFVEILAFHRKESERFLQVRKTELAAL